jgi:hypothetical protein
MKGTAYFRSDAELVLHCAGGKLTNPLEMNSDVH